MRHAGHVVAGKYELRRMLGQGSMGEVWLAHHGTLDHDVALKLLKRSSWGYDIEDLSTATARFRLEAMIAARLSSKTRHIVRVTDHGEEGALAYLVMELLEGQTLESWLMHHATMPLADVPRLVTQIARALEEAHAEGVVHRDLKPGNIFLTRDEDGGPLVKLLDFGIARAPATPGAASAFATAPGVLFGTPGYMSPEQVRVSPRVDRHCDLWALATVAYELLTGELPVPGANAAELLQNLREGHLVPIQDRMPELPRSVGAFFQKALAPRPEDRYPSARGLAVAFERAGAHDDVVDGPTGGAGGTMRMPTLRMDVPALVSSAKSRSHSSLGGRAWVAGLVLLGLVAAAGAWRRREPRWRPAAASPPAATIEPVAATTPVVVPPPTPDDLSPARDVLPASSDPGDAPLVRPARRPVPASPSAEHAPAEAASPAKPDCRPPYWIDPHGTKRWKAECF